MKRPIINEITQQTNNKYLNLFELNGINSKDKTSDKVNGIVLTVIYVVFLVILGIFMR